MRNFILFLVLFIFTAGTALADINSYISDLNISAKIHRGDFKTQVGVRFGTSSTTLEVVLKSVDSPAEAAVVLWLKDKSKLPLDKVLSVYRGNKKKGWGAIAKKLGIKPGSAEFHALKQGNIGFNFGVMGSMDAKKGKSNNKGKGKYKSKK